MKTASCVVALALASGVAATPTRLVERRLQTLEEELERYTHVELEEDTEPEAEPMEALPGGWLGQDVASTAFDNFGKLACQKLQYRRVKKSLSAGQVMFKELKWLYTQPVADGSQKKMCVVATIDGEGPSFEFEAHITLNKAQNDKGDKLGTGYEWGAQETLLCTTDDPQSECDYTVKPDHLLKDKPPSTTCGTFNFDPVVGDLERRRRRRGTETPWQLATVDELKAFPDEWDVRDDKNYPACRATVENVKSQGSCGSCYAFAATGVASIVSCVGSKDSKKKDFTLIPAQFQASQQQVLDCATEGKLTKGTDLRICLNGGMDGVGKPCHGGHTQLVLDYLEHAPGIDSESAYPYEFGAGDAADHMDPAKKANNAAGACRLGKGSDPYPDSNRRKVYKTMSVTGEAQMMAAIQATGAIGVGFDVYDDIFAMTKNTETPDMSHTVYRAGPDDAHALKIDRYNAKDNSKCVKDVVKHANGSTTCFTQKDKYAETMKSLMGKWGTSAADVLQDCLSCKNRVPGRGGTVCECTAYTGGHAVTAIGWGHQKDCATCPDTKYWLLKNSWGNVVGKNKDGIFKYLRGVNHGRIEENAVVAFPVPVPETNWAAPLTKCLEVVNGDQLAPAQSADKCFIKNSCSDYRLAELVPGECLFDKGRGTTPVCGTYLIKPPDPRTKYLVPPSTEGFMEAKAYDIFTGEGHLDLKLARCQVMSDVAYDLERDPEGFKSPYSRGSYVGKAVEVKRGQAAFSGPEAAQPASPTPPHPCTTDEDVCGKTPAELAEDEAARKEAIEVKAEMIRQYAARNITVPCPCPTLSIDDAKWTRVVDVKGVDVMLSGRPMWMQGAGAKVQWIFYDDTSFDQFGGGWFSIKNGWYRGYAVSSRGADRIRPGKRRNIEIFDSIEVDPQKTTPTNCPYNDGFPDTKCAEEGLEDKLLEMLGNQDPKAKAEIEAEAKAKADARAKAKPKPKPMPMPMPMPMPKPEVKPEPKPDPLDAGFQDSQKGNRCDAGGATQAKKCTSVKKTEDCAKFYTKKGLRCRERTGFMSWLTSKYSKCKLSKTKCSI